MEILNDTISYIPAIKEPLSADVAVIKGNSSVWLFDVGNFAPTLKEVNALHDDKNIIISHFHADHMGNLTAVENKKCYVGSYTYKYCGCGTVVDSDLYIEDGHLFHIFPLPSSHAKGSLALELDEKYIFTGDGLYGTNKGGRYVYNAQLLLEEIRVLEKLKANLIIQSHRMNVICSKDEKIKELKEIYARRNDNEVYIDVTNQ